MAGNERLSKLAAEMTGDREGLSTTAWLMKQFIMIAENLDSIKSVPNGFVVLEAMGAQTKNMLNEASANIEVLEKNNFQLQETITKAAAESPALYQTYMASMQKLQTTASELKDSLTGKGGSQKAEPLNTQQEKATKLLKETKQKKTLSPEDKLSLEKKLLLLNKYIDEYLKRQDALKQEQLVTAKRFGDDARSANIVVPTPKLN